MKIIKFILVILKEFISKILKEILSFLIMVIVCLLVFALASIIPIIVAYLSKSSVLFLLSYPIEMMVLDIVSNKDTSDTYYIWKDIKNYFKTKWNDVK